MIKTLEDLTPGWLAGVLGQTSLTIDGTQAIGTGQMSQSHRISFTGPDGPGTVVLKLASDDPTSRGTGVGMGAYWREVSFYQELAGRLAGPVPECHHAEYDPGEGWFTLVLEDIKGAQQGDQIAGCSVEEARAAMRTLAQVHGPVLGDLHVGTAGFLNQPNPLNQALASALLPGFLERYEDRVAPEHREVCERFVPVLDAFSADRRPPLGLVHGDYRLDNLLFSNGDCRVVDWQTVSWGPAHLDLSYFIAGAFDPPERRAHEEELVRLYHDGLLEHGVQTVTWDHLWEEYRRQSFYGILMTICASMVVVRTDRGDDMFMTWLARNAQQVLDLDALDLLPSVTAGKPPALRPEPSDEGRHPAGPEVAWNESWYFDAVSDDGSVGMYTRLGRVPNQGNALFTASIVRAGKPSIMLVDPAAPLPDAEDDAQVIAVDGLRVEQHCEKPLQRFRVTLQGRGEAFEDQSAPLRGESGEPVDIAFDLVWETAGVPYQWRQATRYEIPCRVTGTITIADEQIEFAGPGQRDHSWGARDWFANDWMWNGLHLDDGTHSHMVAIPQMPGLGIGYVQKDGEVDEIESLTTTDTLAENGLTTHTTTVSGDLVLEIEPIAYGPILLQAPDGRTAHFARAMARVTAADGRTGSGWIEWNRNQG
jgi:hypothetical protein